MNKIDKRLQFPEATRGRNKRRKGQDGTIAPRVRVKRPKTPLEGKEDETLRRAKHEAAAPPQD